MLVGAFELDVKAGELRQGTQTIRLQKKPCQVLLILVEHGGEVVSREEIQKRLWPNDTVVDFEHGINTAIKKLRAAFGDSADNPKYIETLARRGYRLMMPVDAAENRSSAVDGLVLELHEELQLSAQVENPALSRTAPAPSESSALIGRKVSHYRVLAVIGGGGMGLVYKAEDLKLGRQVALKFLPQELANDAMALQRFEREAQTASSLNHSNICTIYEIEEHEGQPFIVMELLEGGTLRDRLASSATRALPLDQLLDIAIQICDGLQAAHERGIIHRDIKPANIFVTDKGVCKILDFGLAKLATVVGEIDAEVEKSEAGVGVEQIRAALPKGLDATLTRTGVAMGTAGYMSPEQVRREKLDARTDIFSFGLVLYEMATGRRAFTGETAAVVYEAILKQPAVPVRDLNSTLPAKLVRTIDKALEKDREKRYRSAAEMHADLSGNSRIRRSEPPLRRWLLPAIATAVVLTFIAGSVYWRSHRTAGKLNENDTIVLADFANSTGDSIFDGTLNTAWSIGLQQSPFFRVLSPEKVSRTLALMKPPSQKLTPEMARQVCLHTGSIAVLAGSIADIGNRYQIELKGLNCQTGAVIAKSETQADDRNQVIKALGDASARLRGQLGEPPASLREFNQPLETITTASMEALQGYTQSLNTPGDAESLPPMLRAVELDPNFAFAYLQLCLSYSNMGQASLAKENCTKAYQLRHRVSPRNRFVMEEGYYGNVTGEIPNLIATLKERTATFPHGGSGHNDLGVYLMAIGQYGQAGEEERIALRLMPEAIAPSVNLIGIYTALNQLDAAQAAWDEARARQLDGSNLRWTRYRLAFVQGDYRAMQEQVTWGLGKPAVEDVLFSLESDTAAYHGSFAKAREFSRQAVESAMRARANEMAAIWKATEGLREAEIGNVVQSKKLVADALALSRGRSVKVAAALTLARSGDTAQSQQLVEQLNKEFPLDTLIQEYALPTIRAAIELQKNNANGGVDLLKTAVPYEMGRPNMNGAGGSLDNLYPAYVRGQAYLKLGQGRQAAAEFQKMIDHPGIVLNFVTGALAHLQLGRAQVMAGDNAAARQSYQDFLALWKDADADIPIYQQAKAEYAKLEKFKR